MKWIEGGVEWS